MFKTQPLLMNYVLGAKNISSLCNAESVCSYFFQVHFISVLFVFLLIKRPWLSTFIFS